MVGRDRNTLKFEFIRGKALVYQITACIPSLGLLIEKGNNTRVIGCSWQCTANLEIVR